MGEVYLAEDTRLGRRVAVKLLTSPMTRNEDAVRRFTQEAHAASALNHPNIVTVHDIGECDGERFLVMEWIAGETMRAVARKRMAVLEMLPAFAQMARAIRAAHAAGITHRDLKPENIMLREDGYVKVLDFGLARLSAAEGSASEATMTQHTVPGQLLGTMRYMSPEQTRGEAAGPASDIFSLGLVIHELASGQYPFAAGNMMGYLHAINSQTAPALEGVPEGLAALVTRMLAKDARGRPSAAEVADAMTAMERGNAPLRPAKAAASSGFWIAVLPFRATGTGEVAAALAEGLTEEITAGLSRFSYLRVIARSSAPKHVSDSGDIRVIAAELGAQYVIEGSVRQAGGRVRAAVQLTDAVSGAHIWADNFDRGCTAETIFEVQDELVPRIVCSLADVSGVLPRSMSTALRNRAAEELSAYEAVLRAFGYLESVGIQEHADARRCLEMAVEREPDSAEAWAMLGFVYGQAYGQGYSLGGDSLEQAVNASRKAVAIAPGNYHGWYSLAQALFFRKEFGGFQNALERSVSLNPMAGTALAFLGEMLVYAGDTTRGMELAGCAKRMNPSHPGWYWFADFYVAYDSGDYTAALAIARKIDLPTHWGTQWARAAAAAQCGEQQAAGEALGMMLGLQPDSGAVARQVCTRWWMPGYAEHFLDGLRKAGLEIV